ncbi:MAG: aldo/keto reductase [Chloroflexi bacterium]|nr:aldo/keto reductase [Chloroflexota bacterium]
MNPFEFTDVGRSDIEVTRLGLGGAPLSGMILADGLFGGAPYDESQRIIKRAYELGVLYFDTAPLYGEGRSEVRYGHAIKDMERDEITISTKVSRLLVPEDEANLEPYGPEGIPKFSIEFDFTKEGIHRSLQSSLERLGVDEVEIVYLHDSDFTGQHTEDDFALGLEALSELRSAGALKAIGMGMNEWQMTAKMIERFDLDIILLAGRYTLLDQSALPVLMPLCEMKGVSVAIGGPYNSGIITQDLDGPVSFDYNPASEQWVAKARRAKEVCERWGADVRAVALQFPFAHAAVATTIPGSASVEELEQNVELMKREIPEGVWDELVNEEIIAIDAPVPELEW